MNVDLVTLTVALVLPSASIASPKLPVVALLKLKVVPVMFGFSGNRRSNRRQPAPA